MTRLRALFALALALSAALALPHARAQRTPARRRAHPPPTSATPTTPPPPAEPPPTPSPIPPGRATAVAVAGNHTCALTVDHLVYCWGADDILTLLAPRTMILGVRTTPTVLVRSEGATAVLMGGSQPLVRIGESQLVSYGTWDEQVLGRTTHSPEDWQHDALVIEGLAAGTTIIPSADGSIFCALAGGVLQCRGANQYGQLGAGLDADVSSTLVPVVGLSGVRDASSGGSTTCAVDATGLSCWGRGVDGALGTGSLDPVRVPTRVAVPGAVDVEVSRRDHACARDASGGVWCWGRGAEGQVGNPPETRTTPARIEGITGATAIAVGMYDSCAITGGSVRCWGAGSQGQLGNGGTVGSVVPVAVTGLANVTQIALGDRHACGLDAAGAVWCWGNNREGSCGVPGGQDQLVPVRVLGP